MNIEIAPRLSYVVHEGRVTVNGLIITNDRLEALREVATADGFTSAVLLHDDRDYLKAAEAQDLIRRSNRGSYYPGPALVAWLKEVDAADIEGLLRTGAKTPSDEVRRYLYVVAYTVEVGDDLSFAHAFISAADEPAAYDKGFQAVSLGPDAMKHNDYVVEVSDVVDPKLIERARGHVKDRRDAIAQAGYHSWEWDGRRAWEIICELAGDKAR